MLQIPNDEVRVPFDHDIDLSVKLASPDHNGTHLTVYLPSAEAAIRPRYFHHFE